MCHIYDCKHNKCGACRIGRKPCGLDACDFYVKPVDNRTSLNHGPVKSRNRHRFFK